MITLFVGDVTEDLSIVAHDFDAMAGHATSHSQLTTGTFYTSLGDCNSYRDFVDLIDQADVIRYRQPLVWSDTNHSGFSSMKHWTEHALFYFYGIKKVIDFPNVKPPEAILALQDTRCSDTPQLWVAGGSISAGAGIDRQSRYGEILAQLLGRSVSFLTANGSSIEWAADQILRSDIRAGDIVVWDLTPAARQPYYRDQTLYHVSAGLYLMYPDLKKTVNIEELDTDHRIFYCSITKINQVVNILKKLDVTLILAQLDTPPEYTFHVVKMANYVHLMGRYGLNKTDMWPDLASDRAHPGVKSHKWFAERILAKIMNRTDCGIYQS